MSAAPNSVLWQQNTASALAGLPVKQRCLEQATLSRHWEDKVLRVPCPACTSENEFRPVDIGLCALALALLS